jgi:hypothetical protein
MILASAVAAVLRNAPMMCMTRRKRPLPMLFTRKAVLTNAMDAAICVLMDQLPILAMRRVGCRQTAKTGIFKTWHKQSAPVIGAGNKKLGGMVVY